MVKRIFSAIIALIMLINLAACSDLSKDSENILTVYYLNTAGYEFDGSYIKTYDYQMQPGNDLINNALELLGTPPKNTAYTSSLVKGTRVYSYSLDQGNIEVTLSPAYLLLNDLEKTLIKCCLALTLCGIAEIENVDIYVDGKLMDSDINENIMIVADAATNEFEKQINLYFPQKDNMYLQAERRVLTVGRDKPLAEYVMEELLKSTQNEELKASVPEGTKLLSAVVRNGVCTVDLSGEFVENRPRSASEQRLTVYSIVNSLTNLENTEKVIFRIDGMKAEGYEYIDIGDTFSAFEEIVYNHQDTDKISATVYLGNATTGKMVKTPVIIDKKVEATVEETIIRYVLSLHNIGGYETIIPQSVMLRRAETVNGICTIDLTSALFAGGSLQVATLASCAIAASVIDSGMVSCVNITVEGKRYLDNLTKYKDLIIE